MKYPVFKKRKVRMKKDDFGYGCYARGNYYYECSCVYKRMRFALVDISYEFALKCLKRNLLMTTVFKRKPWERVKLAKHFGIKSVYIDYAKEGQFPRMKEIVFYK